MGWDEGISGKALRMRSYHFWDQQQKMSSQPLMGERAPGAGFEIFFEFRCPGFIAKGKVVYQIPGTIFGGMARLAGVVGGQAPWDVRGG
jgi:hypothetical protein